MHDKSLKSERRDDGADLETQFILRLPEEPAMALREAIQSGAGNLKERLSISLENDLRKGMVRLDDRYLYAKVVDIPTIIESLKTIDKKSFYKTADVCQMIVCKESPDPITDDESPQKNKKKDPNKVDKKYLYPHGITPSLKNVRKRRFRKTLKKKNVELPEIEKEVKRLLRVDNEAVNVKWEIVECEEPPEAEKDTGRDTPKGKKGAAAAKGKANKNAKEIVPVDEQNIFGDVSDSEEEEDANVTNLDVEDTRLSEDSRSRFSDSNSMLQGISSSGNRMTEFKSNMFEAGGPSTSTQQFSEDSSYFNDTKDDSNRINDIQQKLYNLQQEQNKIEEKIQKIDNNKLKERLEKELHVIMSKIIVKEMEMDEIMGSGN